VTVQWAPIAVASARRYLHDQAGMRAVVDAIGALAEDPYPADGFHRGRYHRLRVGAYRVLYVVEGDLITIERVDQVATAE
jgi:mRNA-degrading endonuclease RelE of RelBE toxin-antitoxin system